MAMPALFSKLANGARLVRELARLPVAPLRFELQRNPDGIRRAHALFTQRHARYKIIGNKTMGIALIDLKAFKGQPSAYLATVQRSGHAGPQSKKATARGYTLRRIDRNEHIEEGEADYFMYDTYLGAKPGLRDFKRRVGFQPYRARYALV